MGLLKRKDGIHMDILETTDLKKYYGTEPNITKALDGVTLSIRQETRPSLYIREDGAGCLQGTALPPQ